MKKLLRLFLELFVLIVLWMLGIGIVGAIPVIVITVATSIPVNVTMDMVNYPWIALGGNIFQCLGTLLAVYLFFVIFGGKLKDIGFSIKGKLGHFGWGLLYGTGTILCGFLILLLFGSISITQERVSMLSMLACLLTFFFVAVSEEVLCRGAMMTISLKYTNKMVAILVPSLIFGALHFLNKGYSWLSFGNLFLAGIFMGVYYLYYRNLWFSIAIHFAWNFVQGPLLGFAVSGATTPKWLSHTLNGSSLWTGGVFGFEGSMLCLILLCVASAAVYYHFRKAPEPIPLPASTTPESIPHPPAEIQDCGSTMD